MKRNLLISIWMTLATTVLLGIIYPLAVTALAQMCYPRRANGSLIPRTDGTIAGSSLIGQPFTSPGYFHSRPSAAGATGYDPMASGGSNLGPTNKVLLERVSSTVQSLAAENPGAPIPADLATASGSGLDPHISTASAEFQLDRVSRERGLSTTVLRSFVSKHTEQRQLGFLGEPRVNVLELNLELDEAHPMPR